MRCDKTIARVFDDSKIAPEWYAPHIHTNARVNFSPNLSYTSIYAKNYNQDVHMRTSGLWWYPNVGGHRFIISAGQIQNIPELRMRTPAGIEGLSSFDPNAYTCGSQSAKEVLGMLPESRRTHSLTGQSSYRLLNMKGHLDLRWIASDQLTAFNHLEILGDVIFVVG